MSRSHTFIFAIGLLGAIIAFQNCGSAQNDGTGDSSLKTAGKSERLEVRDLPPVFDKIEYKGVLPQHNISYQIQFHKDQKSMTFQQTESVFGALVKTPCTHSEEISEQEFQDFMNLYSQAQLCVDFIERPLDQVCTMEYIYSDSLLIENKGTQILSLEFEKQPCHEGETVTMCQMKTDFQKVFHDFKDRAIAQCGEGS